MEPPDQKVQGGHFELLTVLPEYNWGGCTVFTWRGVAASECEGSLLRVPFQMPLEKGLFLRFSTTVGGWMQDLCCLARAVVVKLSGRGLC